jgi:hypothetical protein
LITACHADQRGALTVQIIAQPSIAVGGRAPYEVAKVFALI